MKHSSIALSFVAVLALALAACTEPGAPSTAAVKPGGSVEPSAAIAAIRAAGTGLDSAVQVQPLRDAAIDGFLQQAHEAEKTRNYAGAIKSADKALALAPDAPDIVQYLAELEIGRSDWQRAEQLAMKSFNLGPKVGSLCARNWQTVVEARTALGDAATVEQARQRVKDCRVAPRLRM